jgi:stage V sporulation protein G
MEITEVRIKLMEGAQDRLLGFCSITIDRAFVVRDLKLIKGTKGPFVAMPSRKLTDRCPGCGAKNSLRAAYCSNCGTMLGENRSAKAPDGRAKLYADIAHPINSDCRDLIQNRVLQAYDEEVILAQRPDYVCRYDDFGEFDLDLDESERWDEDQPRQDRAGRQRRVDAPQPSAAPVPHAPPESSLSALPGARRKDPFGEGVF